MTSIWDGGRSIWDGGASTWDRGLVARPVIDLVPFPQIIERSGALPGRVYARPVAISLDPAAQTLTASAAIEARIYEGVRETVFGSIIRVLDSGIGEPGDWRGNRLLIRFVQDYTPAALAMTEQGMTQIQTWAYFGRYQLPASTGIPGIGDILTIRNREWEVVEFGTDDLDELQLRLIPYQAPPEDEPRGPGRPSRRDEILAAYDSLLRMRAIDPRKPLTHAYPAIRRRLTGSTAVSPGLGDKTLQGVLSSVGASSSGSERRRQ